MLKPDAMILDTLPDFSEMEFSWQKRAAERAYWRTKCAEAQNWRCCHCYREMTLKADSRLCVSLEHIIPLSLGGPDEWHNYAASCIRCNTKQGSKMNKDRLECYTILSSWFALVIPSVMNLQQ